MTLPVVTLQPSLFPRIGETIQDGVHFMSRTFKKIEGTDKFAKLVKAIGDFVTYFTGPNGPYSVLASQLKNLTDFTGFLNLVSRIHDWTKGEALSAAKLVSRIMLTIANFFESIKFLDTVKLIGLGPVASLKVVLPYFNKLIDFSPIGMAKDLFVSASAIANLAAIGESMGRANTDRNLSVIDNFKKLKWELKERVWNAPADQRAAFFNRYSQLKTSIIQLKDVRVLTAEDNLLINAKWAALINRTNNAAYPQVHVEETQTKQAYWEKAKSFHLSTRVKSILAIVNDALKIMIISVAIVGCTILALKTAAFMIPFLTLGLVVGVVGYTKFLFDDWHDATKKEINAAKYRPQAALVPPPAPDPAPDPAPGAAPAAAAPDAAAAAAAAPAAPAAAAPAGNPPAGEAPDVPSQQPEFQPT